MSYLRATGAYLPSKALRSEDIASRLGVRPDWIANVSGIRERRIAGDGETIITMAVAAAQQALLRAQINKEDIGAVLVSSGTHTRTFPGPACEIAHALGLNGRLALDVPVASAGSIFAVALAHELTGRYGNVLVIATEKMSPIALREPFNRSIAGLFGDGAGACIVSRDQGFARLVATTLHTDGSTANDLSLNFDGVMKMSGRSVIVHSTQKVPECLREVLSMAATQLCEVAVFIMHQANRHLMDRIAQVLGVAESKFFSNIETCGNTSSASMLIALDEWLASAPLQRGMNIALAGFGAGYNWGAALLRCE